MFKQKLLIFITIVTIFGSSWGLPSVASAASANSTVESYVVQLRPEVSSSVLNLYGNNVTQRFAFSKDAAFSHIYSFTSTQSLTYLQTILAGMYSYLEADKTMAAHANQIVTNDPTFTTDPQNIDKQWGLVKAGFPEAWTKTTGSSSTVVAIIDTGVDQTHFDFNTSTFVSGYNILTHTPLQPGLDSDDNGHGTLIAGIIGATPNNSMGIAGTNWKVAIMPVKALDGAGTGSSADVSEAIVWAADHGAHIINLSLGGIGFAHDTTLANAITHAFENNVVIVAAAGNDVAITGGNLDQEPVFPICDDNSENMIIGVAATDQNDLKPNFSNFGKACIDVSAPGKRIISTINHDPITNAYVPNAYAYASGTSLAVPFVAGQAALLKSLYPNATNKQIRDRIMSTADSIDANNLTQCGGKSCAGLLGTGRINVAKSLEQEIVTLKIQDGDLVQLQSTGAIYYINGGKKQLVIPFVKNQRFSGEGIMSVTDKDLEKFSDGSYAEPLEGTLLKSSASATVYYMSKGLKMPITGTVFGLHHFKYSDIVVLNQNEIDSWLTGSLLAPPDGSLVRTPNNTTVYWAVAGVLHPINYGFYTQRGLNIFPVVYVSDADMKSFSKGESYVL